jgi:hypothetical protein
MGRRVLDATHPGVLRLRAEAQDAAGVERAQQVIGGDFGRRDELSVSWA